MSSVARVMSRQNAVIFGLLALLLASAAWPVQAAGWVTHPWVLTWVGLVALVVGLALAHVRVPQLAVHLMSFFIGVAVLGYAGATALPGSGVYDRTILVITRLRKLTDAAAEDGASTDGVLFLLFLAALAWLIGYVSAWSVYRYRTAWLAVVSTGAALVVTLSYADQLGYFYFLFAPSALVLFLQVNTSWQERAWSLAGREGLSKLRWRHLRQGAVVSLAVVVVSGALPAIGDSSQLVRVWHVVERPWRDMQNEFSRLFGPMQGSGGIGVSGYGPNLYLQGGVSLSDSVVMEVVAPEARRWRGVVYDRYSGVGWTMEEREYREVAPDADDLKLASSDLERSEIEQHIKLVRTKGDLLFAASLPRSVSVPVRAEMESWTAGQGGGEFADAYTDLGAIRALVGPYRGQEYVVVSAVSRASEEALREAGIDYPRRTWQRYTALPRTVPTRVRALARSLTRAYDNPYDKAIAIESYLRTFTYDLGAPPPPEGRDVVDFFLFDSKVGYCDYFSSSMVVMLRSLGIPARVVAGYLPGLWDVEREVYVVRESDSHSWPEVYFPGYGWVEFEPTASSPRVSRAPSPAEMDEWDWGGVSDLDDLGSSPDALADMTALEEMLDAEMQAGSAGQANSGREIPLSAVLAVLGVGAAGWTSRYLWNRRFGALGPAEAAYAKMSHVAGWLGRGPRPHQTPFEYAESLAGVVPGGASAVRAIARAYVRFRFGRQGPSRDDGDETRSAWRSLRMSLPREILLGKLGVRRRRSRD